MVAAGGNFSFSFLFLFSFSVCVKAYFIGENQRVHFTPTWFHSRLMSFILLIHCAQFLYMNEIRAQTYSLLSSKLSMRSVCSGTQMCCTNVDWIIKLCQQKTRVVSSIVKGVQTGNCSFVEVKLLFSKLKLIHTYQTPTTCYKTTRLLQSLICSSE